MSVVSSCLLRLRAETSAAHTSIETVPMLHRLISSTLTSDEYVDTLDALHAYYQAIEPEIAAIFEGLPEVQHLLDGRRPRSLVEDLAWFAAKPTHARPSIPHIGTAAAGLGALYVIEGSGLGGRVIARRLADTLGLAPGRGASFYGGLSADAARARWQTLCGLLDKHTSTSCQNVIVNSACATFGSLERWMRQSHVTEYPPSLAVTAVV